MTAEELKIRFRKKKTPVAPAAPWQYRSTAPDDWENLSQTISVSSYTSLGVTNNANNFRFSQIPDGENKNSSRLAEGSALYKYKVCWDPFNFSNISVNTHHVRKASPL